MAKRNAGEVASDVLSIMGMGESQQPEPIEETPATTTEPTTAAPTPAVLSADKENGKKPTKRDTHKVYSFWAPKEEVAVWNCYQSAATALPKREDLGLQAIHEYINNHPLTGDDLAAYELELKREGLTDSEYR